MNTPASGRAPRTRVRRDLFNVLYYSWLGEERSVRLLLEAVQGMAGIALTLAGRGELETWVGEAAAKNRSINFLGWLKMSDLESVIGKADLIPSLYEPRTRNAVMATPGKLLTAMSLSIPSLVPRGTYQAEIVEKYHLGIVVDWTDVTDLRKAMQRLANDEDLYSALASPSPRAFQSFFSGR